ncbi:MAG: ATP-binding protein [Lachnospiraceae bacterium]|nr:ATP-binding protein [Lachnospiraceae bacterium]
MSELVMLVGLWGSGKTTYAEKMRKEGYEVFSSDMVRKDLHKDERMKDDMELIFDILNKRVKKALLDGKRCIYDASNIRYKWRMEFLSSIDFPCKKKAIIFATPIETCLERLKKSDKPVSNDVMRRLVKKYWVPGFYEGFDEIAIEHQGFIDFRLEDIMDYSQENPHHTLTLGEHMAVACRYAKDKGFDEKIVIAAKYHDCGKVYAKTYIDRLGNISDVAHYYEHENISAYMFLCMDPKKLGISDEEQLKIATLINWHMRPLYWEMGGDRDRDISIFGEDMMDDLMKLHEADSNAK